jgi:hypothetical protein
MYFYRKFGSGHSIEERLGLCHPVMGAKKQKNPCKYEFHSSGLHNHCLGRHVPLSFVFSVISNLIAAGCELQYK